jgi:hypothetical protein
MKNELVGKLGFVGLILEKKKFWKIVPEKMSWH